MEAMLVMALKAYMEEYPAFRFKPIGSPNSPARNEQERRIELENNTMKLLNEFENHIKSNTNITRGK